MTTARPVAAALVAAGLTCPNALQASSQAHCGAVPSEFALVVDVASRLEPELRELGARGFDCAMVAVPEVGLMPHVGAVLLSRPRGVPTAPSVDHLVVRGRIRAGRADVERGLNAAAAEGFRLCGMTVATVAPPVGFAADEYVAVMSRRRAPSEAAAERYRLIHTQGGHPDDWPSVVASAKEGYLPAPVVWRPLPGRPAEAEVIYLARRAADATPIEIHSIAGGAADTLERALGKQAASGYRVQAAFTGNDWLNVLLVRRPAGPPPPDVDYAVELTDGAADFRVSPFYGALVRMLPFKGGRVAIHDERRSAQYDVRAWEMPAVATRVGAARRQRERLQDDLNGRFGAGYWPVDLLIRARAGANVHTLEGIFERAARR